MTAVDAQMVEERNVVGGVAVPAVLRGDRGARLAAGIALVHRDDAKLVGELGRRVDRRRGLTPYVDDRLQPRRRKSQDRETLAELLVIDAPAVVFEARHVGVLSKGKQRETWRDVNRSFQIGRASCRERV